MSQKLSPNISWSPPEHYEPVESQVSGVVVYAPKVEKVEKDQAKTYKCPNCGANLAYDVSTGGVACEYCGYVAPVRSVHVGKTADEFEFTLENVSQAERGWGEQRQVLNCESCGASLSLPQGALTKTCPFCASNHVNVTTCTNEEIRPRFLIPFKVKPEQTQRLAADWLGKGWFHPDELRSNAALRRFVGIYLPFWTFDTNIHARWRAQVGYERTVRHYNAHEKRWETRTHIEWRWEDGNVHLTIDDYLISGSFPEHISRRILQGIYPFRMSDLVTYEPDYLAGWQAQAYEITLTEAWKNAKTEIREQARQACYDEIPTSHVRNFSMMADFAGESWRYILLPVYLTTYKYEGKTFQMMVNGQTGTVAGQKPVAWWKVWLAIAGLLLPGTLLGLIGLPLVILGGAGVIPIAFGVVLFIIGIFLSILLYNKAHQSEAR